jgi:fatty acid desaturase
VQSTRLGSFVVGAEFAFRWGIFGIAVLTAVFSLMLKEPMDTREDAVVTGFALASFGVLAGIINFSLFGTKYLFFTKYAPSVGYFLAVFWWIWVFSRPVTKFGFKELGMGPEDIAKELRRYRELTERMMRKRW